MREALQRPAQPVSNRGPAATLRDALDARDPSRPFALTLPAPVAHDAVALWDESTDAVLFAPPATPAEDDGAHPARADLPMAGLGVAHAIVAEGPRRFEDAKTQAERFFEGLASWAHPTTPAEEPRFVGGLAFAPNAARGEPWTPPGRRAGEGPAPFGDARFVLPRWTYRIGGERASLQLCLAPDASARGIVEEHERILARLRHARRAEERVAPRGVIEEPPERFLKRVEAIKARIGANEAQKIVAARRVAIRLEGNASPRPLIERFERRHPACARFAMRVGGTTFLGATPERLVALRHGHLRTEALAGTAPRGDRRAFEASLKDAAEHAFVVEAIAEALAPFVERVVRPDAPRVKTLPDVLHLQTPIEGRLAAPAHLLDVAAALHPTPAVGGVPRGAAIDHILAHEPPRGWYAGPFGFFDRHGEGELVVALRSGVLRGDRAWAWAGGGIVRDSSPAAELEETRLKLRPFLGVLDG